MKINGRKIEGPNVEYVVIPRADGDIVFKAVAVLDFERYNKLCAPPKPPRITVPGGKTIEDVKDKDYLQAIADLSTQRYHFLILESLRETDGLEWETVNYDDPSTWKNWEQELKDSHFTFAEIQLIQLGVASANSVNEEKLEQARKRFLATLGQPRE